MTLMVYERMHKVSGTKQRDAVFVSNHMLAIDSIEKWNRQQPQTWSYRLVEIAKVELPRYPKLEVIENIHQA